MDFASGHFNSEALTTPNLFETGHRVINIKIHFATSEYICLKSNFSEIYFFSVLKTRWAMSFCIFWYITQKPDIDFSWLKSRRKTMKQGKKFFTKAGSPYLVLKVVSPSFLLVSFSSPKESTCETWKNVFYFTSKALVILKKIRF